MKIRDTSRQALAVVIGGLAVISILTPVATTQFFGGVFVPAPAMAQTLVEGKGKVIAVTQEKQELVLEHGEIKGFMDAMTMGYKVSSPSLLKGLKSGDQVSFTIDTKKSVITKVTKLRK